MKTHKLFTENGTALSVELKSLDDMESAEYKAEYADHIFIGLTGFDEKDKEVMMWELADGRLSMGELMGFIDRFDHSAIYWVNNNT